jgi:putative flavoprotein involved in K+ transport
MDYAARISVPLCLGVEVTAVEPLPSGRWRVRAAEVEYEACNVVVATGLFQAPKLPPFAAALPPRVLQLHSGQYRRPDALPPGAVLVVGSAQSGCQIAEELYQSGRTVYLSTCPAGRAPRRYRGRDGYYWAMDLGFFDRTADQLPSLQARFAASLQLSGQGGGHTLNLHQFARDGVQLLGRTQGVADGRLYFAPDLRENLASGDRFEAEFIQGIDRLIERTGYAAPPEELPVLRDGYALPQVEALDLGRADIRSVIWANGYRFDFSLVQAPVFEPNGFPITARGVTAAPGLYFLGVPWLHTAKSGMLLGVGADAQHVAAHIVERPG